MNKKSLLIKLLVLVLGTVSVFLLSSCFTSMKIWSCKQSCLDNCNSCYYEPNEPDYGSYGVYYSLTEDGKSYYVSKVGYSETSVVIPETYSGKPVTGIRADAFASTFSGGNGSVGYRYPYLESLTLPKTIEVIERGAFLGSRETEGAYSKCKKLIYEGTLEDWFNIDFGSTPVDGGTEIYIGGEKLTELVVPESVTVIRENAFKGYKGLTGVTFHENVALIEDLAFEGCVNIESLTFACKDLVIEYAAFSECTGLTEVTFTGERLSLGGQAFYGCTSLKSLNWSEVSIIVIPAYAFFGCTALETVVIPASVVAIRDNAFWNCNNLKEVYNLSKLDIVAGSNAYGSVAYNAVTVKTSLVEEVPPEKDPNEGEEPSEGGDTPSTEEKPTETPETPVE